MQAKLYISHHCVLCRVVEPVLKALVRFKGLDLMVLKLYPDGTARQVNGAHSESAGWLPAIPALYVGNTVIIGTGLVAYVARMRRKQR